MQGQSEYCGKRHKGSLGIAPKAKLPVYGFRDAIVMKKLEVPHVRGTMEAIWRKVDERIAKYGELTQEEIDEIIHTYRQRKRRNLKRARLHTDPILR